MHESVPGHHLDLRPGAYRTAGVPAQWRLHRLHRGLGPLFRTTWLRGPTPTSRYGQLIGDMRRAVRLVVDTGIHYFGWDRQRAIDYFANAAKSRLTSSMKLIATLAGTGAGLQNRPAECWNWA